MAATSVFTTSGRNNMLGVCTAGVRERDECVSRVSLAVRSRPRSVAPAPTDVCLNLAPSTLFPMSKHRLPLRIPMKSKENVILIAP